MAPPSPTPPGRFTVLMTMARILLSHIGQKIFPGIEPRPRIKRLRLDPECATHHEPELGEEFRYFYFIGTVYGQARRFRVVIQLGRLPMLSDFFTDPPLLPQIWQVRHDFSRSGRYRALGIGADALSANDIAFLNDAKALLPPDDGTLLETAFRNLCAIEQLRSLPIEAADAATLLRRCQLRVTLHPKHPAQASQDWRRETREWIDEQGRVVAISLLVRSSDGRLEALLKPEGPTIQVLGSEFRGEDFTALYDLCATRTHIDPTTPETAEPAPP